MIGGFFFLHKCTFRNLNDIKQDSDAEYEDDETGDEDTKDETAPFGRKFLVFESNLFQLFQSCYFGFRIFDLSYCEILKFGM